MIFTPVSATLGLWTSHQFSKATGRSLKNNSFWFIHTFRLSYNNSKMATSFDLKIALKKLICMNGSFTATVSTQNVKWAHAGETLKLVERALYPSCSGRSTTQSTAISLNEYKGRSNIHCTWRQFVFCSFDFSYWKAKVLIFIFQAQILILLTFQKMTGRPTIKFKCLSC